MFFGKVSEFTRGLDLEDLDAAVAQQPPHPHRGVVDRAVTLAGVHVAVRVQHRLHVVMVLEAPVAREPDRHRLVPAVHRHQVHVHVHDQIGLGGALADLHVLAVVGRADVSEGVAVLGVEVREVVRVEAAVHALADHPLDLRGVHPTVQRGGHDQLHVLDARPSRHLDHVLQDPLPDVRGRHGRKRDRDVVDRDRELHPGAQEVGQRLRVSHRMAQRMLDRAVHVADPGKGIGRVHHARAEGELLHAEALPLVHQQGRCAFVHITSRPNATTSSCRSARPTTPRHPMARWCCPTAKPWRPLARRAAPWRTSPSRARPPTASATPWPTTSTGWPSRSAAHARSRHEAQGRGADPADARQHPLRPADHDGHSGLVERHRRQPCPAAWRRSPLCYACP